MRRGSSILRWMILSFIVEVKKLPIYNFHNHHNVINMFFL